MGSVIAPTVWIGMGGGGAQSWRLKSRTFMKHQKRTMAMLRLLFTIGQRKIYGNRNRGLFQIRGAK
jgi:hypothetical protein